METVKIKNNAIYKIKYKFEILKNSHKNYSHLNQMKI